MEKHIDKAKVTAGALGAFMLPVFEFMYGEGEGVQYTMIALVFFIAMDWLAGIRASTKDNTYASKYGIDGVFRTAFMLALPAGGHLLDMVMGIPPVLFGIFALGLLYHTAKSMTANAVRAGWAEWLPVWVLEKVLEWVRSEIESKLNRAIQRKEVKGHNDDV